MTEPTAAAAAPQAAAEPAAAPAPARRGPRGLRGAALWLGGVAIVGLLLFVYHYLEALASRQSEPPLPPFIRELTGAAVAGVMFFPVRALVRRLPLSAASWPRRLPAYLAALLALGAAATTLMWGLRSVLFPLAGLGAYDYGVMPLRYLMELPVQVIWFTAYVAFLHTGAALREARARELRAARIESSLARTQLRNLRLQLQPHFLFNALHTISAAMYDDPAAADEMLEHLAELLRASLRTAQSDEVELAEELALLDHYLALQRARFGDRLALSRDIEPGAERALVPSLLLQPLVENAIRHGGAERRGHGAIAVRARTEAGRLVLEVENDAGTPAGEGADAAITGAAPGATTAGTAAPEPASTSGAPRGRRDAGTGSAAPTGTGSAAPSAAGPAAQRGLGLGLAATGERLHLLYGAAQTFHAAPLGAGGFLVRATLPLRRPPAVAPTGNPP